MNRKIVALLQARTDSTRLPKKVLKPLLGIPMIIHQLQRTDKSKLIDKLILLTSLEKNDDELAKTVQLFGYSVYRGSKNNVLERFYKCCNELDLKDSDIVVRLTGDCPVHDAKIIDELIDAFLIADCDYMANCVKPIYPDGLDAEVFTFKTLKQAYYEATKISQKEHVTPYIRNSGKFKVMDLKKDIIYNNWRLTVDEPSDFTVIEKIYNHFKTNDFTFEEMILFLEHNLDILELNSEINRNEGYLKSLQEDQKNG
ncbi:cytidylyltransferase domain-containing protein [Sulfurimonas sp. NW9]|uniref:cytidylyltransferase domain-containing protein n=1 Tax=Sulfurimonas sp. NW9 TaxID=2922728 RepID=UPI003DA9DB1B